MTPESRAAQLERELAASQAALQAAEQRERQREAELAVINSIQRGVAASLDLQGIIDAAGDRLCEVFRSENLAITWWAAEPHVALILYARQFGQRVSPPPFRTDPDSWFIRTLSCGQPVRIGSRAEMDARGLRTAEGMVPSQATMSVPIFAGERWLGGITMDSHDATRPFTEHDERLVQTVASSLGLALDNARSYEAERQRAAELAVINAVQQALAGELNLAGVYDAVGDQLRGVFPRKSVILRRFDPVSGLLNYQYLVRPDGERVSVAASPPAGFAAEVMRSGRSLLINENSGIL